MVVVGKVENRCEFRRTRERGKQKETLSTTERTKMKLFLARDSSSVTVEIS